ncbi:hypothetical protein [Apilactobacillus ozensis]
MSYSQKALDLLEAGKLNEFNDKYELALKKRTAMIYFTHWQKNYIL